MGKKGEDLTPCTLHADTSHTFHHSEGDWGFTNFVPMKELTAPNSPYRTRDDTVELRVEVQVQPDPSFAYDSRKETGFVGLKNQGATCYMNSLVQYLHMLPYFRKVGEACTHACVCVYMCACYCASNVPFRRFGGW